MKAMRARILLLISIGLFVLGVSPARAQAPLEPSQMSPRTVFYLIWRGAPSPDARKANSLLALWDDPDFTPVRSALAANLFGHSKEKSAEQKLSPEEIQEFASLLENSFTVGYLKEPAKHAASNAAAPANVKAPAWNGMFFVYDRTGKEALIAKAILRLRAQQKEMPQISQITLAGVPVLKAESKNGVTYWADAGKYAVSAGEGTVMEEILGRLGRKPSAASSLAQSAAYQEAQPLAGSGILEFFVRIPELKDLATDSKTGPLQVRPLLDAIRLDAVHSLSGHVTFEGPRTRLRATIFGDTSPGTLFDIWSAGQSSPASLALVPADAVSYTTGQVNLPGIYDTVKRIARAAFPQAQQGNSDFLDSVAQQRLGMPLQDALGLLTGEFASMETSPSMDTEKQVYFLGLRNKPETLKLMRTLFSDRLASERNEGNVTYLKLSLGGNQSSAGVAQWHFFNLAVTPDLILGASRTEALREVLANRGKGAAFPGLASVPQFRTGRAQFPENLTGLGYFDFQKVDWQALKDRLVEDTKKNSLANGADSSQKAAAGKASDWLVQVNPQVLSRHLHYSSSASWKDSKGIHWDQWVE